MLPSLYRAAITIACLMLGASLGRACLAESGIVVVFVQDARHQPVRGVEIGVEGPGGSKLTDDHGMARLPIGGNSKEGDWFSLAILHSPPGTPSNKELVMVSPWDNRAQVPSFANKPENFIRVVVVQRGDRAALENGNVLISLVAKINHANSPKSTKTPDVRSDPKINLDAIAKQYGLAPGDVDQAIRALGTKSTNPYEAGMAALYERNYPKASAQLQDSLKQRESKLTADTSAVAQDQKQVADAASFLGISFYRQGAYREAIRAYQRCLQIRPDDTGVMIDLAASLQGAGDTATAEPLIRKALKIDEGKLGSDDVKVARDLNNLGNLLEDNVDAKGAEPLLRKALAINEKAYGLDDSKVANSLTNLAAVLRQEDKNEEAETLVKRALKIDDEDMFGVPSENGQ